VLEGPPDRWRPGPREVLAVSQAAAQAAPLLWNAAGVVAANGSVGAHLFEVARSLGVPAVVGVDVSRTDDGALAAVDGDAGSVSILERVGASSGRVEV
jgi:phosphotransferase system enzyme I (PtsI)